MSDLSYQVRAPLGLELTDGSNVTITSWSLKSIDYPEVSDILPSKGILSIPFQGVNIRFDARFTPGDGPQELLFDGLSGRQRETLAIFYRSILSGKMASTEEIITSLDTPVDLVPMGETEEETRAGSVGKSPRALRAVMSVLFYLTLAMLVFGFVGNMIWGRLSEVRVEQARVVAPIMAHLAPEAAFVERVRVRVGDQVVQGETMIVLSNPERAGRLNGVRADVRRAIERRDEAQEMLARHMSDAGTHRATVLAAYERAVAARVLSDFLSDNRLDEVRRTWDALRDFDAGLSRFPGDFHAVRITFEDVLESREIDMSSLKRRLSAEKNAADAVNIVARADGVVTDVPVFRDQFIGRGELGVEIEEHQRRIVVGWLDETLSGDVYIGQATRMTVNDAGEMRTVTGQVSDITAGIDPLRPGKFGLVVTVMPDAASVNQSRREFRADAPVQLSILRGWSFPGAQMFADLKKSLETLLKGQ
jgi:multidrug resistance efflux pump